MLKYLFRNFELNEILNFAKCNIIYKLKKSQGSLRDNLDKNIRTRGDRQ